MMDVAHLCDLLNGKAEALAPELLPNGHRSGNYWMASGIADTGKSASLAVPLRGARAGHWRDHGNCRAGEEHGDMLDLVELVHCPGDKPGAVAWAKSYLGVQDDFAPGRRPELSAEERARRAEEARKRAEAREAELALERDAKARRARQLFLSAVPIAGTPAEFYLRGRGIAAGDKWPGSIRYHARAHCGPLRDKRPAMVAGIFDAAGVQVGVHRTFLGPAGNGPTEGRGWGKLEHPDLGDPKMVLGNQWGGFVPINKGASRKSMAHMPEGEPVYVTEGIEDALCVRMVKPEARIVCALNLGNVGAIVLPQRARELVIVCDRDDKPTAQDALERAISAQQARGLCVKLVMPPAGVKDINDWLLAGLAPAERRRA